MLSGNGTAAGRAGAGKYLSRKDISPAGLPAAPVACWSAWEQPALPPPHNLGMACKPHCRPDLPSSHPVPVRIIVKLRPVAVTAISAQVFNVRAALYYFFP